MAVSERLHRMETLIGVMIKVLLFRIVVSEIELQSRYYVHFQTNTIRKGMNHLILLTMSLILPLLFFNDESFSRKWTMDVDMPLTQKPKMNRQPSKL